MVKAKSSAKKSSAKKSSAKPNATQELGVMHPGTRRALRRWLATHHATTPGVWLVVDKAASGRRGLPYEAVIEEALCFGWIDGKANRIDEKQFKVMFKPRNPKSGWSAINKQRVGRLMDGGLMAPAGLAKIDEAKRNGAWTSLDAAEKLTIPDDLGAALAANERAAANYAAFAPSSRKVILAWISSAKRPETRAKRIAETVKLAANGIKANHYGR